MAWRNANFALLSALVSAFITSTFAFRQDRDGLLVSAFDTQPLNARDQYQYGGLQSRDICSNAFPGRHKQTCSPSQTLCCINPGASLPLCQTILGYGFCCTEDGSCFVDLQSACNDSGSTQCAKGLCCPAQTKCISNFNYTTNALVRCNIDQDLVPASISSLASTTTAKRTATRGASTGSVPIVSNTAAPAASDSPTSTNGAETGSGSGGKGLSGGAIAGIVIGSVAAVGILGIVGYLLWKRKPTKDRQVGAAEHPPYHAQEMSNANQVHEAPMGQDANGKLSKQYGYAELPTSERPQELP